MLSLIFELFLIKQGYHFFLPSNITQEIDDEMIRMKKLAKKHVLIVGLKKSPVFVNSIFNEDVYMIKLSESKRF